MNKTWSSLMVAVLIVLTACGWPSETNSAPTVFSSESEDVSGLPQFDAPTFERIRLSDVGPHYITGELMLGLDDKTADPWERASAIASEFGGRVSAGVSDLRVYQLRFGDEEIDELRNLADQIAELPNVEVVGVHYVAPSDPSG